MSRGAVEPRVEVLPRPRLGHAAPSSTTSAAGSAGGRAGLPPKWLYDDVGAGLFDEITRLPEYYPTEAERSILDRARRRHRGGRATRAPSSSSAAARATRPARCSTPSARRSARTSRCTASSRSTSADATLRGAAATLSRRYPGLAVEAVVGDFTLHLGDLPRGDRRLVAFLGSTIGNFYLEERAAFLGALADSLEPGEWLLLGTDLVKDVDRLVAAYDDSAGVTEKFIRNCLTVVNRELGADFDQGAFSYAPLWDARMQRVDMRLRAEEPQVVTVPGADLVVELATGEELCVEISTKFRRDGIRAELAEAGFAVTETWTDPAGDFAVTLARRT